MPNDVIAAIATPPGRGGIGVVRVSGPQLGTFVRGLLDLDVTPRRATVAAFHNQDGSTIDVGLVLFFPAPHSYTGEDIVELQAHGGPVVLQMLLSRCLELGARVAAPGEFTQRAYLNDKLDLAQAESVADLINASSIEAARCAVRSLRGEFSRRIEIMVQTLIELRTLVEATLDFPEEDEEFLDLVQIAEKLALVSRQLRDVLAASRQGSLLREGVHVVLAGAPNVGKSSLLNRLAGIERAIVADVPGTTRDTIRESISLAGVPLHVVDTAGLREPQDQIEKLGISKTWGAVSEADLVLWVSDAVRPETRIPDPTLSARLPARAVQLQVVNKIDLTTQTPACSRRSDGFEITLSAQTGAGMDLLKAAILEAIGWSAVDGEGAYMARSRHLQALQTAAKHLDASAARTTDLELLAEELKLAQQALASITGEFTADDLLGRIFSQFCIGK